MSTADRIAQAVAWTAHMTEGFRDSPAFNLLVDELARVLKQPDGFRDKCRATRIENGRFIPRP